MNQLNKVLSGILAATGITKEELDIRDGKLDIGKTLMLLEERHVLTPEQRRELLHSIK